MKSDFLIALTQLAAERNLPREMVINAIEAGLASAYRKDSVGAGQNVTVRLNPGTGEVQAFAIMDVVSKVEDDRKEITKARAKKIDPKVVLGGTVEIEITAQSGGRIAAQTAKQVVMQRLREAERNLVFEVDVDPMVRNLSPILENNDLIFEFCFYRIYPCHTLSSICFPADKP